MPEDCPEDKKEQKKLAESEPKYKKQVQVFVCLVVGVLALALIVNTFTQSHRAAKGIKEQGIVISTSNSEADFDKRLEDELAARKLSEKSTEVARSQKDGSVAGGTVSPDVDFKDKERLRALEARKSKFNIKKTKEKSAAQPQLRPQARRTVAGNFRDKKRTRLAQEKSMAMQQLAALTSGGGVIPNQPDSRAMLREDQDRTGYEVKEVNAGQPKSSVSEPRPGQKLVTTGTILSAVLDQDLVSDYVGPVRMRLSQDVYDVNDRYIIMPKGCIITGTSLHITNVNEPIQARMGIAVKWLVLPNGSRISFENVFALDQVGIAAIKDKVNRHLIAQFLGVMAYAMLSSETSRTGTGETTDSNFSGDIGESIRKQFAPLAAKYLTLVPTVTLRSGTPLKIFLEDDIYAYPWQKIDEKFL